MIKTAANAKREIETARMVDVTQLPPIVMSPSAQTQFPSSSIEMDEQERGKIVRLTNHEIVWYLFQISTV